MRISAQLYTVRHCGRLANQLDMAATCGFADVETTGLHELTPPQMAEIVQRSGLRVRSAHFDWEEFEDRFDEVSAVLNLLDCPVAIMPWLSPEMRPKSRAGWSKVAHQLSAWATRLAAQGVRLGYHNHDFDLLGEAGDTPLDLILSQGNIYWQPDIGWVVAVGLDPVDMVQRHAGSILSIHAKDVDPTEQGDDRWRDLGQGVVDWGPLLAALARTGCADLFVEHDESPDLKATLETGRRFLEQQLRTAA